MRHVTFAAALILALSLPMAAQSLDAQLQKAIQIETVTGDLKAAIEEYRRIAETAGAGNRRIAAQALVRMAECHRKLGNAEAQKIFERVARDFADQPEAAAEARTGLAALRNAARVAGARTVQQIWSGAGVDPMGAPSADGRVLSYTDWNTGDLGIRDLVTGQNRRLTNTGGWEASGDFAEFSVPSPDGRDVAYAWFNDGPPSASSYDLRVISITGSQSKPRVLHASKDLRWVAPGSWTPDGKALVFVRESKTRTFELAMATLATGEIRVLAPLTSPSQRVSVSPDGRYVAFDQHPPKAPNARDIFVMAIDGGRPVAIAPNAGNDQMPLWSADGSQLLFLSTRTGGNALWSTPMQAGQTAGPPELIKGDAGTFYPLGITRSGALYYFEGGARDNAHLATLDAGAKLSGAPALISEFYVNSNASAAWSPDGASIAYYSFRGLREASGATLVIRRIGDSQERAIPLATNVPRGNGPGLRWFPDGRSVLISGRTEDALGTRYVRVDLETGREHELHRAPVSRGPGQFGPVLSRDGRALFFIEQESWEQQRNLKRVDLDTGAVAVIEKGWINSIARSPDGQQLAYIGTTEGAASRTSELRIIPAAGGAARTIFSAAWFDNTRFNTLSWSPDGRHLLFVRSDNDSAVQALWRIPAGGGEPQRTGVSVRGSLKNPHLHPDGRRLLFTTREFADASIWVLENFLPPR